MEHEKFLTPPEFKALLKAAKEILAEVFGARPSDVEEMIRLRLEERSWSEEGQWPERLCRGSGHRSRGIEDLVRFYSLMLGRSSPPKKNSSMTFVVLISIMT
jgi:hypothetical protein